MTEDETYEALRAAEVGTFLICNFAMGPDQTVPGKRYGLTLSKNYNGLWEDAVYGHTYSNEVVSADITTMNEKVWSLS